MHAEKQKANTIIRITEAMKLKPIYVVKLFPPEASVTAG